MPLELKRGELLFECRVCGKEYVRPRKHMDEFHVCTTKCDNMARRIQRSAKAKGRKPKYKFQGGVLDEGELELDIGTTNEDVDDAAAGVSTFKAMARNTRKYIQDNYPDILPVVETDVELLEVLAAKADLPKRFHPSLVGHLRNTKATIMKAVVEAWTATTVEEQRSFQHDIADDLRKLAEEYE